MTTATARQIATAAAEWFTTRAADEHPSDWSDRDSYTRFVAHLNTGGAWAKGGRKVTASVRPGSCWQYVAADALDHAAQLLGDGPDGIPLGRIDTDPKNPNVAYLTW